MRNEMTIEETRKVDKWVTSTMAEIEDRKSSGEEDQQKEENEVKPDLKRVMTLSDFHNTVVNQMEMLD